MKPIIELGTYNRIHILAWLEQFEVLQDDVLL